MGGACQECEAGGDGGRACAGNGANQGRAVFERASGAILSLSFMEAHFVGQFLERVAYEVNVCHSTKDARGKMPRTIKYMRGDLHVVIVEAANETS